METDNNNQQITDELLADADAARDLARKAITIGFDQTVNESRRRADDAMKRIAEIERMIDDAEQKTRETNLSGA
jgi:laminin gamma 1